jgi:hypothetical protein
MSQRAKDTRRETSNLLRNRNWRLKLVGCVALLAAAPDNRPLDALIEAKWGGSWVSPQLLATTSLIDPSGWSSQVEAPILDRHDAKAAAALRALVGGSQELIELAKEDSDMADDIGLCWRIAITDAFDGAGLYRSWC